MSSVKNLRMYKRVACWRALLTCPFWCEERVSLAETSRGELWRLEASTESYICARCKNQT